LAHPRIPKPLPITAIGTVIQGRKECITHLLREAGLLISDVKNYMDFLLKALEGCTSRSAFLRGEFDAAIHSLPKIKRVLGSLCPDSFRGRCQISEGHYFLESPRTNQPPGDLKCAEPGPEPEGLFKLNKKLELGPYGCCLEK